MNCGTHGMNPLCFFAHLGIIVEDFDTRMSCQPSLGAILDVGNFFFRTTSSGDQLSATQPLVGLLASHMCPWLVIYSSELLIATPRPHSRSMAAVAFYRLRRGPLPNLHPRIVPHTHLIRLRGGQCRVGPQPDGRVSFVFG